jgi:hypothetical protein
VTPKHPPGPPMTLGNMRELGVPHLIGYCLKRCLPASGADRRVGLPWCLHG